MKLRIALVFAAVLALGACREVPQGPQIRDVRPTTLERGDTLVIELAPHVGVAGHLRPGSEVTVRLTGRVSPFKKAAYDGGLALSGRAVGAPNADSADRILVTVAEPHERSLGGHARFTGRVEIALTEGRGGVLRSAPVTLDLFPRSLRRLSEGADAAIEQRRLDAALGMTLGPSADGPVVKDLVADKPAARAGLVPGGVLRQIDDQPATVDGFYAAVAGGTGAAKIELRAGGPAAPLKLVSLPRQALPRPFWGWLAEGAILFGIALVVVLLAAVGGGFITVWERKVAGRMQSRIGPNRVGPNGWLQWLADALKLMTKEDIVPDAVDRPMFLVSPYLVFAGVFLTFMVLPFSQLLVVADLNIGFLYLLSVTSLVVVGTIMGGWASNSKWSLLGGMRSAAQIISYELPAGIALMCIAVVAGTLSPQEIIRQQGGWPHQWFIFHDPALFVAFIIYFISALAEGNRTPFDLPEAESELVSGYNTEYSGFRFGAFATAEWVNLWVIGALATALFFGGWQIPGVSEARVEQSLGLQLLSFAVFFAKAATGVFVTIWLRWTLPRFRIDQMMGMCWKYLVPGAIVCLLVVAGWVWAFAGHPGAQLVASGVVTFVCGILPLAYFLLRVRYTYRATGGKFDFNVFR
ncbi:MAG TPA: NADH-quinone oxidoreductase subunit NuoH [Polyangia bacterium]